jgi:tRNA A37 threonylcarbamoyladenosine biosynthesis protein TsaE
MDIKKIVTDYIKAENTDYAIMVTGVWGSGKTFFWKHTLKQAIEKIKIPGQETENVKKYSSARVSLFGLTDVNQIRQRMLEACDLTVLKNTVIVRWALLSGAGLGDYLNGRTVEHC